MNNQNIISEQIPGILEKVSFPDSTDCEIDTCKTLYELASSSEWTHIQLEHLNFLSERLDISKRFFLGYHANGRKAVDTELIDNTWLELAAAILFKAALESPESQVEQKLKRFNVIFKVLDLVQPTWLLPDSELGKQLASAWLSLLQTLPTPPDNRDITKYQTTNIKNTKELKLIPLTILFYEGPIARAYLETIKSLGFKPEKIIELVVVKDIVNKKPVGRWLPEKIRKPYAASIHRGKIHYWPKHLQKTNSDMVTRVNSEVGKTFGFAKDSLDNATSLLPLTEYSQNVVSLIIDDLTDNSLHRYLSREKESSILFTGGGLMPASLFDLQPIRFLHIHPGFLPDIRGADCALWSTLIKGHTSATCFYLSPEIDTGDIIQSCWLPKLNFDVDIKGIDTRTLYRIAYSFIDPWIRAFTLREVLKSNPQLDRLDSVPQNEKSGLTYHFMHEEFRQVSLNRLFN